MIFKCNKCEETKELHKSTMILKNNKWVIKEALCVCGDNTHMEQVLTPEYKDLPNIKLNDSGQKLKL